MRRNEHRLPFGGRNESHILRVTQEPPKPACRRINLALNCPPVVTLFDFTIHRSRAHQTGSETQPLKWAPMGR